MTVQQQLSGTIVVIIIAMAVQVCIMLVIVVKRQIMRFALRNRRGPHTHIGQGGPKPLRREIDRRLDYVAHIRHEPALTSNDDVAADILATSSKTRFRIAAIEEMRNLEYELACFPSPFIRTPCGNLRSFLLTCLSGPLRGIDHYLIHQVCDDYDHARHHFEDFGEDKFKTFQDRVCVLRNRVESNRSLAATFTPSNQASASPKDQARKRDKKSRKKCGSNPQLQESRALLITSTNSANCTSV